MTKSYARLHLEKGGDSMSKKHRKKMFQKKPFKNKKIRLPIISSTGKESLKENEEFYYILTSRGVKKFPNCDLLDRN